MKSIRIFTSEKERKIAWYCSVVFMSLAWVFLAGLFVVVPIWVGLHYGFSSLGSLEWEAYCTWTVYLFVLIVIPVQLARYFRNKKP